MSAEQQQKSNLTRYIIGGVLTVVLVGVIFGVLFPKFADMRQVWHDLSRLAPGAVAPVVIAVLVNMLSNAPVLQAVTPGLDLWHAFVISQATQAVSNTLPAGEPVASATKYAMLRDRNIDGDRAAGAVAADAMYVAVFRIGMPAAAAIWAVAAGARQPWLIALGIVSTIFLIGMMWLLRALVTSEQVAIRVGRFIGGIVARMKRHDDDEVTRATWVESVHAFRAHVYSVVTTRWTYSLPAMLVQQLSLFAAFVLSLRAFNIDASSVSLVLAFTAFTMGRLMATIAQVPAGIGVLDLGFVGILSAGSSASNTSIVAAVLLFRVISWLPATVVGFISLGGIAIARARRTRLARRAT